MRPSGSNPATTVLISHGRLLGAKWPSSNGNVFGKEVPLDA
jgi:hypothetical protein